jgi:hypothetical protein
MVDGIVVVQSINGVKPFVIQRRRAVLVFAQPEYEGIHIEARLDVDLRTFLDLQQLAGQSENNPEDLRDAFRMFGDQILDTWNLQDEDGTVLPADAEGFLCLPPALGTAILGAWSEAATTAGEASASA